MPRSTLAIACYAALLLLVGCVAIEGRASNVQFGVRTGNNPSEPSSHTVIRMVQAWARRHHFVEQPNPPLERYESVTYALVLDHPPRTFYLDAGYVPGPKFNQVLVGISAPYRKEDQAFLDAMVAELRGQVPYELLP